MEDDKRDHELIGLIGDAVRTTRWRRGVSQRELADQIAVSRSRIARLENDAGSQNLADVLGVLAACGYDLWLVDRNPEDETPSHVVDLPRDFAGRRYPAHGKIVPFTFESRPWWYLRHGGWITREPRPVWAWARVPAGQRAPEPEPLVLIQSFDNEQDARASPPPPAVGRQRPTQPRPGERRWAHDPDTA